jgi:hypothetical protein
MPRSTACADTGNQSTITFASGITATLKVRSIEQPEESVGKIECSDISTQVRKKYIPEDLVDSIELVIEFLWDTFDEPPALGLALGLVTLTYPTRDGETTPATRAGTAYVSGIKHPTLKNNELQVGILKVQFDGVTPPVYTKST